MVIRDGRDEKTGNGSRVVLLVGENAYGIVGIEEVGKVLQAVLEAPSLVRIGSSMEADEECVVPWRLDGRKGGLEAREVGDYLHPFRPEFPDDPGAYAEKQGVTGAEEYDLLHVLVEAFVDESHSPVDAVYPLSPSPGMPRIRDILQKPR